MLPITTDVAKPTRIARFTCDNSSKCYDLQLHFRNTGTPCCSGELDLLRRSRARTTRPLLGAQRRLSRPNCVLFQNEPYPRTDNGALAPPSQHRCVRARNLSTEPKILEYGYAWRDITVTQNVRWKLRKTYVVDRRRPDPPKHTLQDTQSVRWKLRKTYVVRLRPLYFSCFEWRLWREGRPTSTTVWWTDRVYEVGPSHCESLVDGWTADLLHREG